MSKVFIEEETLIGIGNAIREKSGTTDLIATTDMATAISNLATGGGELKYVRVEANEGGTTNIMTFNLENILPDQNTPFIATIIASSASYSTSGNGWINAVIHPLVLEYDGTQVNVLYRYTSNSFSSGYSYKSAELNDNLEFIVNFSSYIQNGASYASNKYHIANITYIE